MNNGETARRGGLALAGLAAAGGALALLSEAIGRAHEARVPPDGDFLEVEGGRLHYVDRGRRSGPAIVMVHGLGGQLRNFTFALSGRLEAKYRVIAVDRPGSGYSTARGPQPGLAGQANCIAGLIEALDLDRPLLVGHSLGGAVSLALAEARPELVRGLALAAPLTQPVEEAPAAFAMLALAARPGGSILTRTLAVPMGKLTAGAVRQRVFAPEPVPPDFEERGGGYLALRPANIGNAAADLRAARDEMAGIASRYGTMDLPVSILFGRGDAILDPDLHGVTTAAAIRDARLTVIGGGHMIPLTRPDETARFVEEAWGR